MWCRFTSRLDPALRTSSDDEPTDRIDVVRPAALILGAGKCRTTFDISVRQSWYRASMALSERHVSANDVRVPTPANGEALVVDRYKQGRPKAVVLNPADYAFLRETAALVDEAMSVAEPLSAGASEARDVEDRPRDELLVEDSRRIAELLGL